MSFAQQTAPITRQHPLQDSNRYNTAPATKQQLLNPSSKSYNKNLIFSTSQEMFYICNFVNRNNQMIEFVMCNFYVVLITIDI